MPGWAIEISSSAKAGPEDAPVVLLPHGYPCSSFQFRRLIPALADRWHTIAFDWSGSKRISTKPCRSFAISFRAR
nr:MULTISPECIES: alpha/beta fold hydrolase [unclassified Mesorhizobium]